MDFEVQILMISKTLKRNKELKAAFDGFINGIIKFDEPNFFPTITLKSCGTNSKKKWNADSKAVAEAKFLDWGLEVILKVKKFSRKSAC